MIYSLLPLALLGLPSISFSHPVARDATQNSSNTCSSNSYTLVSNDGGIWPYRKYMSTNASSPDFKTTKTSDHVSDGLIFMTLANNGIYGNPGVKQQGAVLMDSNSDLVWFGPTGATSNFLKQSYRGEAVITVWTGTGSAASGGGAAHGYGQVEILNSKYETVKAVCPTASSLNIKAKADANISCVADVHESYITDSNTMLVTVYNITQADLTPVGGPKNGWITNSLAVEVDIETSQPIFIWDPLQHVPLSASHNPLDGAGTNSSNTWDWFHMNAIQSVNGGYLVNSRQTWSSYFVSKSGEVEWELDGETGGTFGDLPSGYNFVSPTTWLSVAATMY